MKDPGTRCPPGLSGEPSAGLLEHLTFWWPVWLSTREILPNPEWNLLKRGYVVSDFLKIIII